MDEIIFNNPGVFFVVDGNEFIAWNSDLGTRHALSLDAVRAIVDADFRKSNPSIREKLQSAGILVSKPPKRILNWQWDAFSKMFHFGTFHRRSPELSADGKSDAARAKEYMEYCSYISDKMPRDAFETRRGDGDLELQFDDSYEMPSLLDLLENRRTSRTFNGGPISKADICLIVDETFRYRPHDKEAFQRRGVHTPTSRRSAPSGGSLQSCEAYLVTINVEHMEKGLYHYRSHDRTFGVLGDLGDDFKPGSLLSDQMFANDLSAIIIITCRFDKLMWKYTDSRAYRASLLDAGHLSQIVQLLATGLGVRTWVTGVFYDDEIRALLKMEEDLCEYPLIVVGLGKGEVNPFDRDLEFGALMPQAEQGLGK